MALIYHKRTDPKTAFALWKIEESAEELLSQLQLKAHETAYLEKINTGKRYLHWLSTRVLLRKMLGDPAYIECLADENGKPYLTNFPYYISLSHSFDYAAVMISEDKEVGIDIEQIKQKIGRISGKFMKAQELEFISTQNSIEHLYACWCAKEAVYKLQGKRNVSFKDHILIKPFTLNNSGTIEVNLSVNGTKRNFLVCYEKFEDYMIGYCSAEAGEA